MEKEGREKKLKEKAAEKPKKEKPKVAVALGQGLPILAIVGGLPAEALAWQRRPWGGKRGRNDLIITLDGHICIRHDSSFAAPCSRHRWLAWAWAEGQLANRLLLTLFGYVLSGHEMPRLPREKLRTEGVAIPAVVLTILALRVGTELATEPLALLEVKSCHLWVGYDIGLVVIELWGP